MVEKSEDWGMVNDYMVSMEGNGAWEWGMTAWCRGMKLGNGEWVLVVVAERSL